MKVKIIYPEVRTVEEKTVISWAKDEWQDAHAGEKNPETLEDAKALLEDRGVVTFQSE